MCSVVVRRCAAKQAGKKGCFSDDESFDAMMCSLRVRIIVRSQGKEGAVRTDAMWGRARARGRLCLRQRRAGERACVVCVYVQEGREARSLARGGPGKGGVERRAAGVQTVVVVIRAWNKKR